MPWMSGFDLEQSLDNPMNSQTEYDVLIVGQGLAGTCLAWQLLLRGQRVMVIDREEAVTSSKIAAGLMTPVTGKRFVLSWRYAEFFEEAVRFYRDIEQQTESSFLNLRTYTRIFRSEQERVDFVDKRAGKLASIRFELLDSDDKVLTAFHAPEGALQIKEVGQLQVAKFLEVSRNWFRRKESYREADIDPVHDVQIEQNRVVLDSLDCSAKCIVYCRGVEDRFHPLFSSLPFLPAKGEILTMKIPQISTEDVISQGIWLAPNTEGNFRIGSTYDWDHLNQEPTAQGGDQILKTLSEILRESPHEIINHQAAVRPAMNDQKPLACFHTEEPRIGILNGLGSKGSLQAPWLAKQMVEHIVTGRELDPEFDGRRKLKSCLS